MLVNELLLQMEVFNMVWSSNFQSCVSLWVIFKRRLPQKNFLVVSVHKIKLIKSDGGFL